MIVWKLNCMRIAELYRLVSAYDFKVQDPGMRDDFKQQNSYWAWLFKRTMQGKGNDDECIDWQAIQQAQTAVISKLSGSKRWGHP